MNPKEIIAKRIAREIKDGDVVNLGIGLPTMVADYLDTSVSAVFQSENGFVGLDKVAQEHEIIPTITNAGSQPVTIKEDAAFFDSAMSFCIIRGGHVDVTVLGGLQVDEDCNLANYMVPGKMVPGMGGAMDLVSGAKKVIVAMTHTAKGEPKIMKKCTLPLTGKNVVSMVVTELAVFTVENGKLKLREIHESTTVDEVLKLTEANVMLSDNVKTFE